MLLPLLMNLQFLPSSVVVVPPSITTFAGTLGTSGTIGLVQFNTQLVVDHAFRAVRMAPQQIAGENLHAALEQLSLMLSAWANEGTPLWCQTKYILPLQQGKYQLSAPVGTVDILESNLRQCTRFSGTALSTEGVAGNAFDGDPTTACTEITSGGSIALQLATPTVVENVGIMPGASGVWSVSLQYSPDGITWTTFYTNVALIAVAGQFLWMDFQGLPAMAYWRLLAGTGTVLNVTELFFGNNAAEIPIARINKDDYWNLPNKTFQGRPVQYWADRQVAGPVMNLWPAPGPAFVFNQVTLLVHRHIMDIGAMTQTLEVPQRTFDAVIFSLAERLRLIIPEVDKQATADIPQIAKTARMLFWGEERDDSPINLQLNIGAYTR